MKTPPAGGVFFGASQTHNAAALVDWQTGTPPIQAAMSLSDLEFRRAAPSDAEDFVRLMSDESVIRQLLQTPYPSLDAWRKRLENNSSEPDALHLVAVAEGRVVASAGIHPVRPGLLRLRHVGGLGIGIARQWQGRGLGRELIRRLLEWADGWTGYRRIELSVFVDNERAIALYQAMGFVTEGRLQAYALRDGQYTDVLAMARLHPELACRK